MKIENESLTKENIKTGIKIFGADTKVSKTSKEIAEVQRFISENSGAIY